MDFLAILGYDTSLYHSQGGGTEQLLCNPDREFGICILTQHEHPNFQLNYRTGTAIGFHASREYQLKFLVYNPVLIILPSFKLPQCKVYQHYRLLKWCLNVVVCQLLSIASREFSEYIKSFQFAVQSLQHYCRQAIRHSMRSNVLYAAKTLPIPVTMQNYLVFVDSQFYCCDLKAYYGFCTVVHLYIGGFRLGKGAMPPPRCQSHLFCLAYAVHFCNKTI